MKNIIADIKKSMNVKEKFSIIQGDENKTFFKTSDILVTNNQIDNRFNQFTFERVIDQIQFDFDEYSKLKNDEVCFGLHHIIWSCRKYLNRKKINEAKQELINYATLMVKEADLQDKERANEKSNNK